MRQMKAAIEFTVNVVEEDGSYWAEVAEIPGCFVSGCSEEEIRVLLPEAMLGQLPVRDAEVTVGEAVGRDLVVVGAPPPAGRGASGHPAGGPANEALPVACQVIDHPARTSRGERGGRRPAAAVASVSGTGNGEGGRVLPMAIRRQRPAR